MVPAAYEPYTPERAERASESFPSSSLSRLEQRIGDLLFSCSCRFLCRPADTLGGSKGHAPAPRAARMQHIGSAEQKKMPSFPSSSSYCFCLMPTVLAPTLGRDAGRP
jgi:hypothetical protein